MDIATSSSRRPHPAGAWLRLMRPHFAFLSLGAGLVGMASGADRPTAAGIAVGIATCALGYGIGQVVNDYMDRAADAINAPDRPFVTGAVDPRNALVTVALVLVLLGAAALVFAPGVALWSLIALLGHGLYTLTKRVPLLGNLVNGPDVAVFTLIGAAAAAPSRSPLDVPLPVLVNAGILALALTGLGLVSYFKDVPGDRAVGYRTIVVALGPNRARWWAVPFPVAALTAAASVGAMTPTSWGVPGPVPFVFWVLLAASAGGFAISLGRLFAAPQRNAYPALLWQTRATVVLALALGSAVAPLLFTVLLLLLVPMELAFRAATGSGQA